MQISIHFHSRQRYEFKSTRFTPLSEDHRLLKLKKAKIF